MAEQESPKIEAPAPSKAKKPPTPEEFITQWPLYTIAPIEGFFPPHRVSFQCGGKCGKETTWQKMVDPQYMDIKSVAYGFNWVWYLCGLCNSNCIIIVYREAERAERPAGPQASSMAIHRGAPAKTVTVVTKVQKIGQYPAQSVDVSKGLQKNLGEEAVSLYKKGLANRNFGYGLGAVTYIRRVVEDKTDELIEVAAQMAESHNVDSAIVEKIRSAITERTTYDQKLKIASTVLPDAVIVEGVNPLAALYSLVSEGVHALTEEQCIAVADETASVFEFIFTNLRAITTARHDFVAKVTKWAARGGTPADIAKKPDEKV